MKKLILVIFIAIFATVSVLYAQSMQKEELPKETQEWERLAEKGDTAAMHKLLLFYDNNAPVYLDVEEIIEVESDDEYLDTAIVVDDTIECDTVAMIPDEMEIFYSTRLEYWLSKGLEINDPIATYIKGMRLYYTDETGALKYLSQAAEMGYGRAALYCGSALFNQSRGQEAIKYLKIADELGEQSAGWHLAMCYVGNAGVHEEPEKAIHYLVKSALNDYPEAVLEMKRIDPENPLWQHKADSLQINFSDFPIIPVE